MNFANIFIMENLSRRSQDFCYTTLCVTDRDLRPSGKRNTKKLSALIYGNGFNFAGYVYQFSAVIRDRFGGPLRNWTKVKKKKIWRQFKNSIYTPQLFLYYAGR